MKNAFRLDEWGVPPGGELQTAAIQRVIDRCAEAGGGEVLFQDGTYRIASLRLRSGVTLHLSAGTYILASDKIGDYEDFHVPTSLGYLHFEHWHLPDHYIQAPIVAFCEENVGVVGEPGSVIDGADCFDPEGEEKFRGPHGMVFSHCRGVTLEGYTYKRSANWAHQIDASENVIVRHVTVLAGHDGVDVHHCRNVLIDECVFRTGDDCVAGYNVENLTVRKCFLKTSCNGFRIGGRNLLVDQCTFDGGCEYPHRVSGRHNSLFAFEYYALPGDRYDGPSGNWLVRDCRISGYDGFLHYDPTSDPLIQGGSPLISARFENVTVDGLLRESCVTCPEGETMDLGFENCRFAFREGAQAQKPLCGLQGVRVAARRCEGL